MGCEEICMNLWAMDTQRVHRESMKLTEMHSRFRTNQWVDQVWSALNLWANEEINEQRDLSKLVMLVMNLWANQWEMHSEVVMEVVTNLNSYRFPSLCETVPLDP